MEAPSAYPVRLPAYVGREDQKALLRRCAVGIGPESGCSVVYFEAKGGLGKTRLLQCCPEIMRETRPELRIASIIDLYDFENRSAEAIERRLIAGLVARDPADWHCLALAQVEAAFADYRHVAAESLRSRVLDDDERRRDQALRLRDAFVEGWNRLAMTAPLVMRFDTLETLAGSSAPDDALVNAAQTLSERELVSGWMRSVLPRLRRTLVILTGRPVAARLNPLVSQLQGLPALTVAIQPIEPLAGDEEIRAYVGAYGVTLGPGETEALRQLTGGRPLLLTCWTTAKTVVPGRPLPANLTSCAAFEDWLVDTILDPLAPLSLDDRMLAFGLYALSYARRGLHHDELAALLAHLGVEHNPAALRRIADLALVKAVATPDGEPTLFLHDEVYHLIDQSGKPDDLGLREPALAMLCALSHHQVEAALDRISLLRAMANHMAYEMVRDTARGGYACYAIYVERLLRERKVEEALILSDIFWTTLLAPGRRRGRPVQPGLEALREAGLTLDTLVQDEQVRTLWLLHAQEEHQLAAAIADDLITALSTQGTPFSLQPATVALLSATARRQVVDLVLAWASNAARVRLAEEHGRILDRCSLAIAILEGVDDSCRDYLLSVRRDALLGQAYLTRGLVHFLGLRFTEAQADTAASLRALRQYQAQVGRHPHDPNDYNLVQSKHLLATLLALDGALDEALHLSGEVLAEHLDRAATYHKALYYYQHVALLLRRGDEDEVAEQLAAAEKAAYDSRSKRARGLIAHCRGVIGHRQMLRRGTPEPTIDRHFAAAAALLQNEPGFWLEVCRDWAAFDIDLARLYAAAHQPTAAHRQEVLAADLLDEELTLNKAIPPLHAAELLTLKAMISPTAAPDLLAAAEERLQPPLPAFAHVIWGRIALQRALRASADGDLEAALVLCVVALTHMITYAPRHYDRHQAEAQVAHWAARLPITQRHRLARELEAPHLADAPATTVASAATADRWDAAWAESKVTLTQLLLADGTV